jgi:hypothetical protein
LYLPPAELREALLDFDEFAPSQTDKPYKPDSDFMISKVPKTVEEKLLLNLKAGIIKDIFKFKYLLEVGGHIGVRKINQFSFRKSLGYLIRCQTQILLSLLLNRHGDFVSIDASPNFALSDKPVESNQTIVFDPDKLKSVCNRMLQTLFIHIDIAMIESIFKDVVPIDNCRKISFDDGSLVAINRDVVYAFKVSYEIEFSIFLDTKGNFIGLSFSRDAGRWEQLVRDHFTQNSQVTLNIFDTRS